MRRMAVTPTNILCEKMLHVEEIVEVGDQEDSINLQAFPTTEATSENESLQDDFSPKVVSSLADHRPSSPQITYCLTSSHSRRTGNHRVATTVYACKAPNQLHDHHQHHDSDCSCYGHFRSDTITGDRSRQCHSVLRLAFKSLMSHLPMTPQYITAPVSGQVTNNSPANIHNSYSHKVELIRRTEFKTSEGHVYLDHAGATLYPQSLVDAIHDELSANLLGNPHSASIPSRRSTDRIEQIRLQALRFLGCDPEHFDMVFTSNATAAIKLVMEGFRDTATANKSSGFWYGYHYESHNSLVGVRESTRKSLQVCFESDEDVEEFIRTNRKSKSPIRNGLFAYPGQSNLSGRRLPWGWNSAMRQSSNGTKIYTLMDTAALSSTSQLWGMADVDEAPDFAVISFYKIFGLPDLGCLIVKKRAADILTKHRSYFGGGTVDFVTSIGPETGYVRKQTIHEALEEGTIPFHNIIMLGAAIRVHRSIFCDMFAVSAHTQQLTYYLYTQLRRLKNPTTGCLMVVFYQTHGHGIPYGNSKKHGAVIAFNLLRRDSTMVPHTDVERILSANNIHVRSGSICNPGGFATYLNWSPAELAAAQEEGHSCTHPHQHFYGKPTGVVRASLGASSSPADVDMLVSFLRDKYVNGPLGAPVESLDKANTSSTQHRSGSRALSLSSISKELPTLPIEGSHTSFKRAASHTKGTMIKFGQMFRRGGFVTRSS